MENAAEALKMAGAVLIFVLAISIIILSFGQVRQTVDIILDYRDRETSYINGKNYYETNKLERQVGLETIIPSITRAYIENYKIVFENLNEPIYTITLSDGTTKIKKYSLDLETNQDSEYKNVILADDKQKSEFLCGILYHRFEKNKEEFNKKFNVELGDKSLYDQLKNAKITEKLGVYYQDDNSDVPDVNKTEKRIITYTIER